MPNLKVVEMKFTFIVQITIIENILRRNAKFKQYFNYCALYFDEDNLYYCNITIAIFIIKY